MPSTTFPRTFLPETVSAIEMPAGRRSITGSGKIQTRNSTLAGCSWTETFGPLFAGDANAEAFLSWLRWAWKTGQKVSIKHLMTPGSGRSPNGTGSAGVTVDGGSQSGSSILTTGWPVSTSNVVRAGDLVKFAGITRVFQITDDANSDGVGDATLNINPSIYVGEEPANGAAVTTTDVTFTAVIMNINLSEISNAFWYDGVTIGLREAP